jgi:hypothetical protein
MDILCSISTGRNADDMGLPRKEQSPMSTNSSALVGTWIDAESEKPPKLECYGEFWHSVPVLVTDGKQQWVGYWQSWEDGESLSSWYVAGPDGYQITGVTHWMPLPNAAGQFPAVKKGVSNE